MSEQMTIHYGPVWYRREVAERYSFAACEVQPPAALSTHKPWVNCEACRQTAEYRGEASDLQHKPRS